MPHKDDTDVKDLTLLDENGQPRKVSSLWKDRTAVLVFVRHFG